MLLGGLFCVNKLIFDVNGNLFVVMINGFFQYDFIDDSWDNVVIIGVVNNWIIDIEIVVNGDCFVVMFVDGIYCWNSVIIFWVEVLMGLLMMGYCCIELVCVFNDVVIVYVIFVDVCDMMFGQCYSFY